MDAICKTCVHCTKYIGQDAVVLQIKTHDQVQNDLDAIPFHGMSGAKCSLLDFFIMDVAECNCYEEKTSNE